MFRAPLVAAMVLLTSASSLAPAQVADEKVDAAIETYNRAMQEIDFSSAPNLQVYATIAENALEGLNIDELSAGQISRLYTSGVIQFAGNLNDVFGRVRVLMKQEDEEGAHAALLHARLMIDDRAYRRGSSKFIARALSYYLEHPEAEAAAASDDMRMLFEAIGSSLEFNAAQVGEALEQVREEYVAFVDGVLTSDDPRHYAAAPSMIATLSATGMPEEKIERFREGVRERVESMLKEELSPENTFTLQHVMRELYREERIANLVGSEMPELTVRWSSDPEVNAFDDYRGKVLVLDFWATWCGPCVASFPNIRALREHYDGYDVAIVGVTSVQGTHYPKGGRPIACESPAREFELMREYMKENDITWDVVFTDEDVFNPDYGVQGIPHVVIIDPDGVIRHRGLRPTNPGKKGMIDALLEEFGKQTPAG